MAQDQQTFVRARSAALVGLAVQFIFCLVVGVASFYANSGAIQITTWELIIGLPIWVILVLVYHQHKLERVEALEAEQLSRVDAATAAIFDEHGADLQIARRRLQKLYKWGINSVSLLVGLYLLAVGIYMLTQAFLLHRWMLDRNMSMFDYGLAKNANPALLLAVFIIIAFICFILARYEAGMAKISEWQLLRGGASFLMGNFLIALLISVGLVGVLMGNTRIMASMLFVIPGLMVVLGAEVLLNFVLGAYRPRRPGEVPRPAFDSRLLGMFTSPKSLAKALSDAINYQFGFEVSRSWFYQLLGQAITPLVVFGIVVLLLASMIVVVAPQQKALILDGGGIRHYRGADGATHSEFGPGLHWKYPWPFGSAIIQDVGRLQQLSIGSAVKGLDENKAILWTNAHAAGDDKQAKEDYLVAAPTPLEAAESAPVDSGGQSDKIAAKERTPGVSLVGLQLQIQYRVADLEKFVTASDDSALLLRYIAERRLSAYVVTQDIESLIGPARRTAGEELRKKIQADVDDAKLGVELVFVGMVGVHPPTENSVAEAFQEQIEVQTEAQTKEEQARRDEIVMLARVAGSKEQADKIAAAIEMERIAESQLVKLKENKAGADELKAKEKEITIQKASIDDLLADAQGLAAEAIYKARAYRWRKANVETAKAERFVSELKAYERAPNLYRMRRYLEVLTQGMAASRKFVLVSHNGLAPTMRLDLKDAQALDFMKPEE